MSWQCYYRPPVIQVTGVDVDYLWGDELRSGSYELLPDIHCNVCASPVATEYCGNHEDLYGFNRIFALGKYIVHPWDFLLSSHIRFFKKERRLSEPLAKSLDLVVRHRFPELLVSEVITPVPMHTSKLEVRGFNQAAELSFAFSSQVEISLANCLIQTKRLELRELNREERFKAVRGAFEFNDLFSEQISGKNIILIDDVVTTGSTASECSRVLLDNGARQVNVLILGRTCDE